LGNSVQRFSKSKLINEPAARSFKSTRRNATVMTSAPDASKAARVSATSLYLPVPTISREAKLNRPI
jgi:hypothetical protein